MKFGYSPSMFSAPPIHRLALGTRASALALAQSSRVARAVEAAAERTGTYVDVELVHVTTKGDVDRSPLVSLGGSGVFVARLREALLAGECDFAVHSCKDLPSGDQEGLVIAALPRRADPRDVLCSRLGPLNDLPRGARVGTGSPRRAASILALRPDLEVVDIRGNVTTRLRRIEDDLDAVVLAAAGLIRLDLAHCITEYLEPVRVLPPAAQGALAIETRADADPRLIDLLASLDDPATRLAVTAERSLMNALGAGCAAPVGAFAHLEGETLLLEGAVLSTDGARSLRLMASVPASGGLAAATGLGEHLAAALVDAGAGDIADLGASHRS